MAALACAVGLAISGPAAASESVAERTVSEIDARYLAAASPAWRRVRAEITAAPAADLDRIAQAVDRVGDPDLHLVSPQEFAGLRTETNGARRGTGLVEFGVETRPGEPTRIVTPVARSPAARAGIRPGDRIVAVGRQSTAGLDNRAIMARLREPVVELTIEHDGRRREVRLRSDPRPLTPISTALRRDAGSAVGVVRIAQFTPGVARGVAGALLRFERTGVRGYVLDLRDNPGGLLDEAAATARLLGATDLGALRRADGREETIAGSGPIRPAKPLLVIMDAGTASAAEYLAATLRLLPNTRLAGARGAGRGQAQAYAPLADGWGVVIPSARLMVGARDIKADPPRPDDVIPQDQLSRDEIPTEALRLLRGLQARGA